MIKYKHKIEETLFNRWKNRRDKMRIINKKKEKILMKYQNLMVLIS